MKFAAVIPAYNEANTIGPIISTCKSCPELSEVIVVNDGSNDETSQVAHQYGAVVVDLPENQGKGAAVMAGVQATNAEVIVLVDADLIGFRPCHIHQLIEPVRRGRADMTVGVFESGRAMTDISQKIAPFLNGQRAIVRTIFDGLSDLELTRYGVDITLSRYAKQTGMRVEKVKLKAITQVMKEEKLGFWKGFSARIKMYWEILLALGYRISNH